MAIVKHIEKTSQIANGSDQYILIMYGRERKEILHRRGLTITMTAPPGTPTDIKRLEFLATVDQARRFADRNDIPTIYVIVDAPEATPVWN